MAAIAFLREFGQHIEHTATAGTLNIYARYLLFDPGGVGEVVDEVAVTVAGIDTVATISLNIAAAIRSDVTTKYGVTINANLVVLPVIQRL